MDKMAAISQSIFSDAFSGIKNFVFCLKFTGPINNIPALIQKMAWRQTGDKPLSEPMLTQFTDAYMRHQGEWVKRFVSA